MFVWLCLSLIRDIANYFLNIDLIFGISLADYDFVFFSSFLLENSFYVVFLENHLLVQAIYALAHVATPYSFLKTLTIVPITSNFLTSTTSGVKNLILSF